MANAVSTLGAAPVALPLGPTTALESAITFVNLAVPSSLGRMATKLRYFQSQGISLVGATTMSALDSLMQFAVQLTILGLTLGLGFGSVELDFDFDTDRVRRLVLVMVAIMIGLGAVAVAVAPIRRRVLPMFAELRSSLQVLRSPLKAAQLVRGNAGAEVLFAMTIGVCLHAYGESASIADLLVINSGVALFSGLMPVPGGIGFTEAALTAGLTAVGVPSPVAFATALSSRLCTFYLPPIWGWFALRWLQQHRYL